AVLACRPPARHPVGAFEMVATTRKAPVGYLRDGRDHLEGTGGVSPRWLRPARRNPMGASQVVKRGLETPPEPLRGGRDHLRGTLWVSWRWSGSLFWGQVTPGAGGAGALFVRATAW